MRGFNRLQERNLNILGYDVIQICYREWNSIHMNLPGAREDFLRKFLNKYDRLINWHWKYDFLFDFSSLEMVSIVINKISFASKKALLNEKIYSVI